ncbi:ABC transporter permease [Prosthecomicrobium hirschii]|uniref:ABC transporter permease n=1 Tax=Prosthecodimorpha hirschii TaxID=665126 RepID=A0A0P6VP12_9HYPH|nr:ABC transporter permease [Prosthecomicrobium hirschii]KPL54586.1 ABC transporter permease [Prosthecomicrobium hirschii]
MQDLGQAFATAWAMLTGFDPALWSVVLLSLKVSLGAVAIASALGIPLGAMLAVARFPGRGGVLVLLNAMMGLPPVVIGLLVYLLLSASGPFGVLHLLYTPTAMVVAQTLLVLPIVAALSRQVIEDLALEYADYFRSLGLGRAGAVATLIYDARFSLTTAVLAGFGRAIAEVGAVMIVGGNIDRVTRVMTTTIALETSKGNIALALALGLVLILIAVLVNVAVMGLRATAARAAYA